MHGYLSRDGMPPAELLAAGRHEVQSYGGDIVDGTVTDLVPDGRTRVLGSPRRWAADLARRLVVTTGLRDDCPTSPGSAAVGPRCPALPLLPRPRGPRPPARRARWHPRRRPVRPDRSPVDPRPRLLHPTCLLTATERTQLLARAIGVVEGTIEQLVIDDADHLRGVQMRDGCVIPRDALFVPPRFVPNNTLLAGLGATLTPTAGSPSTPPAAPASAASGPPGTSSTRAPRSSPPPAPAPRPPSP